MVNTNTQPLYEIRSALVEFRDELSNVTTRFDSYFQMVDEQLGQKLIRLTQHTNAQNNSDSSSYSRDERMRQLEDAKRLMRQYQDCKVQIQQLLHGMADSSASSNESVSAISRCIGRLEEYLQEDFQVEGPVLSLRR